MDAAHVTRPPLGVSLAGIDASAPARAMIEWAAARGFRGVAVNGAAPGTRARDLDRSGRRELAAMLRRAELAFIGIDLWIPPQHFVQADRIDRAVSAVVGAVELAADVSRLAPGSTPVVSLTLPGEGGDEAVDQVIRRAEAMEVSIADHARPPRQESNRSPFLKVGLDPATALMAGVDPASEAARFADRLGIARLSDAGQSGRVAIGMGELDVDAYAAALSVAGHHACVTADLRGVSPLDRAAEAAINAW